MLTVFLTKKKDCMFFVENGAKYKGENKINPNLTAYR